MGFIKSLVLFLALVAVCSTPLRAGSRKRVILVSDIDDTIRLSMIHPEGHYLHYLTGLVQDRAFTGMPALLQYLGRERCGLAFFIAHSAGAYRFPLT